MNVMKKWLSGFIVLLSLTAVAQSNTDAAKLLEEVINKTTSYSNFKADLDYTMVNVEMNIDEKKSGVIYVQGDAYRLEMEGQMIICDGHTVWTYLPDSEEVMVSNVEDSDESISPTQILSKYSSDYKARFSTDKNCKDENMKAISLKPEEGNKFEKMTVIVNAKKLSLESFSIYDKNGNIFTYNINSLIPDQVLSDTVFTFNEKAYPDVEVIDMR
jgi:outer membrane lipoprotein-sorting protein